MYFFPSSPSLSLSLPVCFFHLLLFRSFRPFRNIERYLDQVGWMSDETWACQISTFLETRITQTAHQTLLSCYHSFAFKACRHTHTHLYICIYRKMYMRKEEAACSSFSLCVVFFSFFLVSFFLLLFFSRFFCCSVFLSLPSTDYIGVSVGL